MTERKRGPARYINVYERADGTRWQERSSMLSRAAAQRAGARRWYNTQWKCVYRLRVRFFLEPKQ
jgi:hypothetical protein